MPTKDLVIAIAGAALILAVLAGVFVIESREGAREHGLEPLPHMVQVDGGYRGETASGTSGPGGTCVPEVGQVECTPARFRLDLQIDDLPTLGVQAHYVAFLVGQGVDGHLLGALREAAGSHSVQVDEEFDASSYDMLELWVAPEPDPEEPVGLLLWSREIDVGPQESSLGGQTEFRLSPVSGWVRTSQTGAFTVSALVAAEFEGSPPLPGWSYHAWFLDGSSPPVATHLGTFEISGGSLVLDERIERVRVEDQVRFLVTLEPEDGEPVSPQGLPAYGSRLRDV